MIKSITTVRSAGSAKDFQALASLFDSLGFERGQGWKDGDGEGASFLAPLGNLEIFRGVAESAQFTDLLVEVSDLETVHAQVSKTIGKKSAVEVTGIQPTSWMSQMFWLKTIHLKVAFWQHDMPKQLQYQTIEGDLHIRGARFGIVVSRFNQIITDRLLHGALDAFHRTGSKDKDISIVRVPGCFEIPIAAHTMAKSKKVDAVICLGLLMRGETSNYEHISDEVARGIGQAAQETGVPCSYGVLTCDTLEQAIDRAGLKMGNKGFEAAMAAVEMVSLQRKMKAGSKGRQVRKRK